MADTRLLFALVGAWSALTGCTSVGQPAGSTLDPPALECLPPSDADLAAVQRLVAVATPGERLSGVRSVPLGNGYSLVAAHESGSRDGASGPFTWSVDTVWVTNGRAVAPVSESWSGTMPNGDGAISLQRAQASRRFALACSAAALGEEPGAP